MGNLCFLSGHRGPLAGKKPNSSLLPSFSASFLSSPPPHLPPRPLRSILLPCSCISLQNWDPEDWDNVYSFILLGREESGRINISGFLWFLPYSVAFFFLLFDLFFFCRWTDCLVIIAGSFKSFRLFSSMFLKSCVIPRGFKRPGMIEPIFLFCLETEFVRITANARKSDLILATRKDRREEGSGRVGARLHWWWLVQLVSLAHMAKAQRCNVERGRRLQPAKIQKSRLASINAAEDVND